MKNYFINLLLIVSISSFISCENDELNTTDIKNETSNVVSRSTCLNTSGNKSIAIWSYPVSGYAMRCEVWCEPTNPSNTAIRLKARTTHYKWENGTFRTKNTTSVYAQINGYNSIFPGGSGSTNSNNNNSWYIATTNWIQLSPYQTWQFCYQGESTHKVKINGIWYQTVLNLNDYW